jgi:hypothetical protein
VGYRLPLRPARRWAEHARNGQVAGRADCPTSTPRPRSTFCRP